MKLHFVCRFKQLLTATALIIVGMICSAQAQQISPPPSPTPNPCPTVDVSSPDSVVIGESVTFSAKVSAGDSQVTPTYTWAVSAGKILNGQGTSSVTIETTGLEVGQTITATVDVGGYRQECYTSFSATTSIVKKPAIKSKR